MTDNNSTIYFHKIREDHGHMSNFFPCDIIVAPYGTFKTSEHLYQALKYVNHNQEYFKTIQEAPNAWSAAKLGRVKEPALRPDWDTVKIDAMRFTVMQKYLQNPDLGLALVETEDRLLVELAPHQDYFWGWFNGKGENWLGVVLMEVREIIKINDKNLINDYLRSTAEPVLGF